ncbi:mediator of RNA polymerase II transcription complex subunit 8-domain-containing protein [Xylariales sp. AK1849]|nr:mediator of RNA polymerase II transcription complex subunit 8-domain-containing protein [Xylariales sp. AK1849]
MASLNLTQEELKAVDQTRQRLFQLSNSIGSLKADVFNSSPLPSLESLQASADILQLNMRTLLDTMSNHNELFTRLAIHPSTNFPGRTQENILLQLLRKKAEPDVATAMDEGRKMFVELEEGVRAECGRKGKEIHDGGKTNRHDEEVDDDVASFLTAKWGDARDFIGEYSQKFGEEMNDEYTAEEREMGTENVRTGLKPDYDFEDDNEDEDDEDQENKDKGLPDKDADEDDVVMFDRPPPPPPAVPALQSQASQAGAGAGAGAEHIEGLTLENMLRVATRGELPALR